MTDKHLPNKQTSEDHDSAGGNSSFQKGADRHEKLTIISQNSVEDDEVRRESQLKKNDKSVLSLRSNDSPPIAKHEIATPSWGPVSAERDGEVFKAVLFLMDAKKKKQPNFLDNYKSMRWYHARTKFMWKMGLFVACVIYLLVSATDTVSFNSSEDPMHWFWYQVSMQLLCDCVFIGDICAQIQAKGYRTTLSNRWTQFFCLTLGFHSVGIFWPGLQALKVTGIVRAYPIIYYNQHARNAMISYMKTLPSVTLWIGLEFFVIIIYACFCVVLYAHLDRYGESGQKAFQNFSAAFVSLYSLSLTVNNPDVYLPYYKRGFLHIIVFASFLVITYFLIHNIILVRIYQIYCVKLKSNAVQRRQKRRRALCLAFEALDETKDGRLPRALVIHVLRRLWPRYDRAKIEAIMRHTHQYAPREYTFDQFEMLMTALNDRVSKHRRVRCYSPCAKRLMAFAVSAHLLVVVVSIIEFWRFFYSVRFWVLISFFRAIFTADVIYRIKRMGGIKYFIKDRFNVLNIVAILLSLVAIVAWCVGLYQDGGVSRLYPTSHMKKLAQLSVLFASCCDIARIFETIPEYNALLVVFGNLLPAFLGQAAVILTLMHVFCYIGMNIYGGKVEPTNPLWTEEPFPGNLYYTLNFNSYVEGMYTLFCLLVVNNWNVISGNFVALTSRASYLYFVVFEIAVVTVGLSCVTSFFIGNLGDQLADQLQHQEEERRRKETEPASPPRIQGAYGTSTFAVDRLVSLDDCMLSNEAPVQASQYRAFLEAMVLEAPERTGFVFVKERAGAGSLSLVERSPFFNEVVQGYGGEFTILHLAKESFENSSREQVPGEALEIEKEVAATMPSKPYSVAEHRILGGGAATGGVLRVQVFILRESEDKLAYCQVTEVRNATSKSGSQRAAAARRASNSLK